MSRAISIVGFGPGRERANDFKGETWGINLAHQFLTKYDRWYQIHPKNWMGQGDQFGRDPSHMQFLKDCKVPVYMIDKDERVPQSVRYPLEDVAAAIKRPYLTSTVAYAIAHAIYEKVDSITLFGVHLNASVEYFYQRASIEWLLGLAEGRGIEVALPEDCPLLKAPLYARDPNDLQMVALARYEQWCLRYMKEWGDWYSLVGAWKEALDPERKKFIMQNMENRVADVNGCLGGIKEAADWLAMFGGIATGRFTPPPIQMPDPLTEFVPEPLPA